MGLLYGVAWRVAVVDEHVAGWIGLVGIVLGLHFGLFHLLALAWRHLGVPVAAIAPNIVTLYGQRLQLRNQLFLAISQSGRSDDVVECALMAKAAGARTLRMICIVAAPEGVALVEKHHPEVAIYTPVVDRELNVFELVLDGE